MEVLEGVWKARVRPRAYNRCSYRHLPPLPPSSPATTSTSISTATSTPSPPEVSTITGMDLGMHTARSRSPPFHLLLLRLWLHLPRAGGLPTVMSCVIFSPRKSCMMHASVESWPQTRATIVITITVMRKTMEGGRARMAMSSLRRRVRSRWCAYTSAHSSVC